MFRAFPMPAVLLPDVAAAAVQPFQGRAHAC
jgi:hypothetical protein